MSSSSGYSSEDENELPHEDIMFFNLVTRLQNRDGINNSMVLIAQMQRLNYLFKNTSFYHNIFPVNNQNLENGESILDFINLNYDILKNKIDLYINM